MSENTTLSQKSIMKDLCTFGSVNMRVAFLLIADISVHPEDLGGGGG